MRARFVNETMEDAPNQRGNVDVVVNDDCITPECIEAVRISLEEIYDDVHLEVFNGKRFIVIGDPTATVEDVSDQIAEFIEDGNIDYVDYSDEY